MNLFLERVLNNRNVIFSRFLKNEGMGSMSLVSPTFRNCHRKLLGNKQSNISFALDIHNSEIGACNKIEKWFYIPRRRLEEYIEYGLPISVEYINRWYFGSLLIPKDHLYNRIYLVSYRL